MTQSPAPAAEPASLLARMRDSDVWHSFRSSPITILAALVVLVLALAALFAPLIAPMNPFDPAQVFLMDASIPPRWSPGGDPRFIFGTDDQGRDLYSAILYGMRVSLLIGLGGVLLAAAIGITLGLVAGYVGGRTDAIIMRIADVQLTFPAILIALLVDGVVHAMLQGMPRDRTVYGVLILSIGLAFWVQYARTIRGSTMVEKNKDYVQAARLVGMSTPVIIIRHVLDPADDCFGLGIDEAVPFHLVVDEQTEVGLLAQNGLAIITEATLSFLGVGLPATQPSLGTLISIGNKYLFSGDWWIVAFPGFTLALFVLAVNLLGDWLRDALNPRLR